MLVRLFLLFSIIPLVELALLIKVGGMFGLWPTVLIVAGTGILGAYLARTQGFKIIQEVSANLEAGQIPADNIIEGILILIGAVLLITPGLITDTTGFILIIPGTRRLVVKFVRRKIQKWIEKGQLHVSYGEYQSRGSRYHGTRQNEQTETGQTEASIDVDYEDIKE